MTLGPGDLVCDFTAYYSLAHDLPYAHLTKTVALYYPSRRDLHPALVARSFSIVLVTHSKLAC